MRVPRPLGTIAAYAVLADHHEHHILVVMQAYKRVAVLSHGEPMGEGPPETVRRNPAVIAAYLGEDP